MESLNLNTLANSLPTGQQNAEKELMNDFKAAALSITKLYRSSRKTSKRAYNAGYGTACQDLLTFIQQGVSAGDVGQASAGSSQEVEGGGMTIGRVMDWIEARLEAIRATEEEEDEDEEREKDKERPMPPPPQPARAPVVAPVTPASPKVLSKKPHSHRPKDTALPNNSNNSRSSEHSSSSPSPPPSTSSTLPTKPLKMRTQPPSHSNSTTTNTNAPPFRSEPFPSTTSPSTPVSFSETPIVIGAGTKRRHAMMMMLDASSPAVSIGPGGGPSSVVPSTGGAATAGMGTASAIGRRRTRSTKNLPQHQSQNQNINLIQVASEAMDVEEDGRERKRVARR